MLMHVRRIFSSLTNCQEVIFKNALQGKRNHCSIIKNSKEM